jgi:proteic killer suppression protein
MSVRAGNSSQNYLAFCILSPYTEQVILSYRHRGLRKFAETGSKSGIQPKHAERLRKVLTALDVAERPEDMNAPGYGLHALKGKLEGHWSVMVSGNWRLTFAFENENAILVDYQDYH